MESFPECRSGHPSGRQKDKRWGKGEGRTNRPQWPQGPFASISFLNPGNSPESGFVHWTDGQSEASQGCLGKAVYQLLPPQPDQARSSFPGSKEGPQFSGFSLGLGPYVPGPRRHPDMGQERLLEEVPPGVLLPIERSSGLILQLPSPLHAPTTPCHRGDGYGIDRQIRRRTDTRTDKQMGPLGREEPAFTRHQVEESAQESQTGSPRSSQPVRQTAQASWVTQQRNS